MKPALVLKDGLLHQGGGDIIVGTGSASTGVHCALFCYFEICGRLFIKTEVEKISAPGNLVPRTLIVKAELPPLF